MQVNANRVVPTLLCLLQVINDYGPLGNGELLRRFGFVEAGVLNPHDCCQLPADALVAEASKMAAAGSATPTGMRAARYVQVR